MEPDDGARIDGAVPTSKSTENSWEHVGVDRDILSRLGQRMEDLEPLMKELQLAAGASRAAQGERSGRVESVTA